MTFLKKHNRIDVVILLVIITFALAFRLYKIDTPLIEFHSWRQADTLAVARNYSREGINILLPRYDDVSPLQTGQDNPRGYRMVEFPLYNAVIALWYQLIPQFDIVVWGRAVSIFSSIVILGIIFNLALREAGRIAAVVSAMMYAVMPFFVFYTRAILPEVFASMLVMIALYVAYRSRSKYAIILSAVAFALAVLVKPTTVFYALALWYAYAHHQSKLSFRLATPLVLLVVALVPFGLWRLYIQQYPEGIPANSWLITSVSTGGAMYPIFFRPAFFRWIFFERINVLILGSFNLVYFIQGLWSKTKTFLPHTLLLSSFAYLFTFQGGNVQHEYYQILILPSLAMISGIGFSYIYKNAHHLIQKIAVFAMGTALFIASWFISWEKVQHYYYSLSDIPQFAKIVRTFVAPNELIVVDTGGDTTALFAFDRKGSPGIYSSAKSLKEKGYAYIFTYNQQTADSLEQEDPTITRVFANDRFVLLKL